MDKECAGAGREAGHGREAEFKAYTWEAIRKYFSDSTCSQIVKHQIDSFNDFVMRKIEQIVDGFNPIEIHHQYMPEHEAFKHVLSIRIDNVLLSKPVIVEKDGSTKVMMPNDARLRNLTYAAPVYVDVHVVAKTFDEARREHVAECKKISGVSLGRVPIMVRSKYCMLSQPSVQFAKDECRYDYGAYFIINGNEKVVISQDRIAENKTYVFVNNKASAYSHIAEIRSVQESRFGVPKTTSLKLASKSNQFGKYIRVNIHHIKHDVPLFIVFRALGIESDRDIVRYIVYDLDDPTAQLIVRELTACMDEASSVRSTRDAIEYLARYMHTNGQPREYLNNQSHRISILRQILRKEFLPHVGAEPAKKALYLGYMVNKLVRCCLGMWDFDDRDSYINKRVDTPGVLLANLFRQYYGKVVKDMKNMIQKDLNGGAWKTTGKLLNVLGKTNIHKIIKPTVIESGLKYGLATGNWGVKNSRMRQGVAQVLNRLTYVSTISHLRRINTPIEKTGKLVQPRKLHPTQWGVICPSETPEGASVGLVKNLATMASITVAASSDGIRKNVHELGVRLFEGDPATMMGATKVFVNGDLLGVHADPEALVRRLRALKRTGTVNVHTSVCWNILREEIHVCTEGGRCVRPLYIADWDDAAQACRLRVSAALASRAQPEWTTMVVGDGSGADTALVEFMDVEEVNYAMIAMRYGDLHKGARGSLLPVRYTHLEMEPCLMLGMIAGSIPFSDHNQAPRNTYQSAMAKQAIGLYASSYRCRYDTMTHVLSYPQKPLVSTLTARIINCDKLPCGVNAVVAIACFTGFNQEDSVIMNKSAVDRGLFNSTFYRTYREQCNKNHSTGEEEFFCRPDPSNTRAMKPYSYNKLEPCGFVPENSLVDTGDIIIGKCMPQKNGPVMQNKDTSVVLKSNERGFIDRNCHGDRYFTNVNGDGYTFCKVRSRCERIPTVGDKFSSRHGQKGTVGMLYAQQDMPFSAITGVCPDIIMNPHAIPSRMTIGQLMECILGKACCLTGGWGDATPFHELTVHDIAAVLKEHGMEQYGNEILHNPRTGEQIPCAIFMGPTYYQRLKHMVDDKIHSRASNGPVVLLTRQPAEGRARDGGLRLGEMEVECNFAHGIMHFLKERFMECSDNYRVFVCKKCGMMATVNPEQNVYLCTSCKNITNFSEVRIPYACKLLFQEVQTMGIGTKFILEAPSSSSKTS